jgi:hypothetical protein
VEPDSPPASGLSIAASGTSESAAGRDLLVRYLDLLVLVVALPVFLVFDFSLLGYAVAAGAWIAQRVLQHVADRRVAGASERRTALGVIAAATLGRVWLVALAILLVGVLGDEDAGLAAAVLAAVLVTVYLAGEAVTQLSARREGSR